MFFIGDFTVHHKDWLTFSSGTDRSGEIYYNFLLSQMTLFRWELSYSCPWLWFSQFCSFESFYFLCHYFLFYNGLPSTEKFESCDCLGFYWLLAKLKTWCPLSSHSYDYSVGTVFVVIWEMLLGKIYLNSVQVNFVSIFRMKLMYIFIVVNIRSTLIHSHDFQLFMLLP